MKTLNKLIVAFSAAVLGAGLLSCSGTDLKLEPPRPKVEKVAGEKAELTSIYPAVDILFIIDDSGSMGYHQNTLATNMAAFTSQIVGTSLIDYHIGVTTTSVTSKYSPGGADGGLMGEPNFVTPTTPNALKILQSNVMVGTNGNYTERMLLPTILALSEPNLSDRNLGFYRPKAHLAIVYITDAEDQSDKDDATVVTPKETYQFIKNLKKGREDMFSVYAAYVPSSDTNCSRDENTLPTRLEEFLNLAHAQSFSLCDPDYGQKLSNLGSDLFHRVISTVYLKGEPVLGSIKVKYGTQDIPEDTNKGWYYDPVSVALHFGPQVDWGVQPPGTAIDVEFIRMR